MCTTLLALGCLSEVLGTDSRPLLSSHVTNAVAANAEDLVAKLESQTPELIVRAEGRAVCGISLPQRYAIDRNLVLLREFPELTNLSLMVSWKRPEVTPTGITSLQQVPRLRSLTIACAVTLKPGIFQSVCQIANLESLKLNLAVPPADEYGFVTNLPRLKELALYGVTNFTDQVLQQVVAAPHLEKLTLSGMKLTCEWTNLVQKSRSLTNVVLWTGGPTNLTWTRTFRTPSSAPKRR